MVDHEENPSGIPLEIEFDRLTAEQQQSLLEARARAARLQLETISQDPASTVEAVISAREAKASADQSIIDFKIQHGLIKPDGS